MCLSLKAEPALAGGVGQCGHTAMVAIRSAVECNGLHTGGDCPFGDCFADCLRGVLVAARLDLAGQLLILRRGRRERFAREVVDKLHGNMLVTARHAQARAIRSATNSLANAKRATLSQSS